MDSWKPDVNAKSSASGPSTCTAAQNGACYCTGRCMYPPSTPANWFKKEETAESMLYRGMVAAREHRMREARELVKLLMEIGQVDEANDVLAKIREELRV